jgi:hypothetical protein
VIAGAGAAGWTLTRAPKHAREPWSKAGTSFGDARLDALSYAILAPNPHNMQPWRIRLDGDDALTVFCDRSRLLPETDPSNRQITVGFGCFLELLRQAAAEKGLRADATPFPQGEPQPILDERPVASVRFSTDPHAGPDPLFEAALTRRTNRAPFSKRPVDETTLSRICAASVGGVIAKGVVEGDLIPALRMLANDAWKTEWTLDRTRRESIEVTRIGKGEVDASPWGLALNSPLLDAIAAAGVMTRENMDRPDKAAYEQSLIFYQQAVDSAAAFAWTSTATNTRADQIAAGAAWLRMQQAATLAGVAFHPLSQALQEFPEMASAYARAHQLLAHESGATVQMLARLGYAEAPPPAPREALLSKIIEA